MAWVQVYIGSRVEEVKKCMNQLHTISGLLAIHIARVVSTSQTQWTGEMPTQRYYDSELTPIKLVCN